MADGNVLPRPDLRPAAAAILSAQFGGTVLLDDGEALRGRDNVVRFRPHRRRARSALVNRNGRDAAVPALPKVIVVAAVEDANFAVADLHEAVREAA